MSPIFLKRIQRLLQRRELRHPLTLITILFGMILVFAMVFSVFEEWGVSSLTELTPQQLAEAASAVMYERDPASQGMGIQLEKVAPGYAEMKMRIREEMVNRFFNTCST